MAIHGSCIYCRIFKNIRTRIPHIWSLTLSSGLISSFLHWSRGWGHAVWPLGQSDWLEWYPTPNPYYPETHTDTHLDLTKKKIHTVMFRTRCCYVCSMHTVWTDTFVKMCSILYTQHNTLHYMCFPFQLWLKNQKQHERVGKEYIFKITTISQ